MTGLPPLFGAVHVTVAPPLVGDADTPDGALGTVWVAAMLMNAAIEGTPAELRMKSM